MYINVEAHPGLLDDGEWEWYIRDAGYKECTSTLPEVKYYYSVEKL
jgi:hypothetical protein